MSKTTDEIQSQPECWLRAAERRAELASALAPGATMMIMGCGTSAFVAQSMARLREDAGYGRTDWAYASELPTDRSYDRILAITRSGTTTEILQALSGPLAAAATRTAVTADPTSVVSSAAEQVIDLSFADEASVVQTRFPTSVLVQWRAALGMDTGSVVLDGRRALAAALPADVSRFEQFVFLGRGWTIGLAHEAALKMRECARAWAESHPALDYRHGPISAAAERTLVVSLGGTDEGLLDEVRATGATVIDEDLDPVARLVTCQRLAVSAGQLRGFDIDNPRHLTRSVVLSPLEESR